MIFKNVLWDFYGIIGNNRINLACNRNDEIFLLMKVNKDKTLAINYDELCKQVFDLDPQVRFAGIANSKGVLVAGGQRDNIESLLADDDLKMSIHYALQKRDLYTNLVYKLGYERSSITEYDLVTMISIPINSNELFLISTEPHTDYLKIIDYVRSAVDSKKDSD